MKRTIVGTAGSVIALLGLLFGGAQQAAGTNFTWYADRANQGGTGNWTNKLCWHNGTLFTNWSDSTNNNAVFGGTTGTVTITSTPRILGDFRVDSPGYVFNMPVNVYLTATNFTGSENMTFESSINGTIAFHLIAASRFSYAGDFRYYGGASARLNIYQDAGTIALSRATPYTSLYSIFVQVGSTLLLNGSSEPRDAALYAGYTGSAGTIGGTGTTPVISFSSPLAINYGDRGGTLAPGDPAVNGGIGTLTTSRNILFYKSASNAFSVFQVQVASPTSYDQLILIGTNNNANRATFDCSRSDVAAQTNRAAVLDLQIAPTFSGGTAGTYLWLVDNRVIAGSGTTRPNTINDSFINASSNAFLLFTNNVGTGYRFQYKYNVDKNGSGGTTNDFGLLISDILTAEAGGPYSVSGNATLNGSQSGGTAAFTYEWDFDQNGTTDLTGPSPSVGFSYFNTTFAWAPNSTHTVKMRVTDANGVSAWDTASITVTGSRGTVMQVR